MKRGSKQRRALSTQGKGKFAREGDESLSRSLVDAFRAATDKEAAVSLTHPIHTYPARLHPGTARILVKLAAELVGNRRSRLSVVDPFCGGGTVLVETAFGGGLAAGVDANPLAVSIARAKTWHGTERQRDQVLRMAGQLTRTAIDEGRAARRSGYEAPPPRAPRGVNANARNKQLSNWFPPHVRRELECLAAGVEAVKDPGQRNLLTVALSSVLYKVSYRASDTDKSRVKRNIGRGQAARLFGDRAQLLCDGLAELAKTAPRDRVNIYHGDARKLSAIPLPDRVDAVITSPPYAGTYDYVDHHKLRMDFLGYSSSQFAADEIGSRGSFNGDAKTRNAALERFERDLGTSMAQMAKIVRPGGMIAMVIGDSLAGGRAVYADEVVARIAPRYGELVARAAQTRPTFGAGESRAFAKRSKWEHMILIKTKKPAKVKR